MFNKGGLWSRGLLTKFGFWFVLVFIQNGTRDDRLSAIELAEPEGAAIQLDPVGIGWWKVGGKRKKKKRQA